MGVAEASGAGEISLNLKVAHYPNRTADELRSALARAEEEAGLWEARYDVLHRKRNRLLDENAALETQLAAIVERTAKAQREKCAAEWTGQPSGLVSECIRSVSLVTLSDLPEADSGGGGAY